MSERNATRHRLALDIGSNSVGSSWIDLHAQTDGAPIVLGTSVFPAGVDETDDKRGEPKNAKRRAVRRTRITLARRAQRKRELRLKLIDSGLLPKSADEFEMLLEATDPWMLRRRGLDHPLSAHEFGRVLLHLAQRRGSLGLHLPDSGDEQSEVDHDNADGKVKAAIGHVRAAMLAAKARTFGEYMAMERDKRVTRLSGKDRRPEPARLGPREYRGPIRNKGASYEHCADRAMIRHEFAELWTSQVKHAPWAKGLLTDALRRMLDDESGDSIWKHKGLLFGQRRQSWDLGTLGRCVLEPSDRGAPHADMYASYFRVIETVNNIKVIDRFVGERPLTVVERERIIALLRGPLGAHASGKFKGMPKRTCSVSDIRNALGLGKASKDKWPKLNIERDEDREINTDWFHREIVHGAIGAKAWEAIPQSLREGLNRELLRLNPEDEHAAERLKSGVIRWGKLDVRQADALVAAWTTRPKLEKRLSMSRKAVRNLLAVMDRRDATGASQPWPSELTEGHRWLTQIEARKLIAEDAAFRDVTTGQSFDDLARARYANASKGLSARDRHYIRKHPRNLPPAPMLSNPVVRKAIHEVRRHIVEYVQVFGRFPDEVHIELAREARMGAKDADRLLLRNRLRDRIRKDIVERFRLSARSVNQQRIAVDRVVLAVQQSHRCPLCGKAGLTTPKAAKGDDCELAHILPSSRGGHNGLGNLVLAHTKCNREMKQRTPREYWTHVLKGGFEEAMRFIEAIYADVQRPKPKEFKTSRGDALWACYFDYRDDHRKIEQFAKDISDTHGMTSRQDAATKYATRQVMAYLADALYGGKGLPERGGQRRIFATNGQWTSRLRREWGLFFDPHDAKAKGLSNAEEHAAKEKNRGDHRHHAIDAVVIALTTAEVQRAWEEREQKAAAAIRYDAGATPEDQMEAYRRAHPIPPPAPFKERDELRRHVALAVFGSEDDRSGFPKPIAHRPVKRKLIGALHEETLFGPVLNASGALTENFTGKKSVLALTPNHLRMPEGWDDLEAQLHRGKITPARQSAIKRELSAMVDPPPSKSGLVRDRALRNRLRHALRAAGVDPDRFSENDLKKAIESRPLAHASGVPIKSVVLLRTINDPVVIQRKVPDHVTGRAVAASDLASARAYVGGNNHHIEYRRQTITKGKKSRIVWTATIVTSFEAAQRKLARLRAFKAAGVPKPDVFRDPKTPKAEREALRRRWGPVIRAIEAEHPIVDRRDSDELGGAFVFSLAEGEMVRMTHKKTREPGYFVVAKLDKPASVVLVPHWDARSAGERKDSSGKKVTDSKRDQFSATAEDLRTLGVHSDTHGVHDPHAVKVRVSALGKVVTLDCD